MWQKAKNIALLILSEGATRVISFFVIIIVARHLGPQELGYWSYAIAINSFLLILLNLGLDIYALTKASQNPSKTELLLSNILAIKALSLLFLLLALSLWPMEQKLFWLLTLLLVSDFSLSFAPFWLFQSQHRFHTIAHIKITQALLYALFIILFFSLKIDILFLALSYFLANLTTALFFAKKSLIYFDMKKIRLSYWPYLLRHSLYLGGALFLTQIYGNTDKIMIASILGTQEAGWYEAGYKLYSIVLVLFSLIWTVYAPKLTKKILSSYFLFLSLPAFVSATLFFFFSDTIATTLYSSQFAPTASLLKLFALLILIMVGSYGFSSLLALRQKQKGWFYLSLFCALLNITLNLFLIPLYKIEGALWATIVAEVAMGIGSFWLLTKSSSTPSHTKE